MNKSKPSIPTHSRVAIFHGASQPLELTTVPIPKLLPGEYVVRVRCCTLCGSDIHTMTGQRDEPTPTVLGHEAMGEIVGCGGPDTGSVEPRFQVGDRIVWSVCVSCGQCQRCEQMLPQKCEHVQKYGHLRAVERKILTGGLAEYIVLHPKTHIELVPQELPDTLASISNCAVATVVCCFRTSRRDAAPVGSVLIFGAGMLGLVAAAYAQNLGAESIVVVDPNRERLEVAKRFGASQTYTPEKFDSTTRPGYDLVLELSGSESAVSSAINASAVGGAIVLAGSARPSAPVLLDPEFVLRRCLRIFGVHNYAPADLSEALRFLASTRQRDSFLALFGHRFRLDDVELAREFAARERPLRVVVEPCGKPK